MELNRSERIAFVKLAYCGPPAAGKSTNLRALHQALRAERRGALRNLETGGCETLLFAFDPPSPLRLGGFQVRFEVATVPGPAVTPAARKLLLQGADGVVFVADSSRARLHETMASFRETTRQITAPQAGAALVPLVLQYNKRDTADALGEDELEQALNPKRLHAAFATVATRREVFDPFAAVFLGTMTMLAQRPESRTLLGSQDAESWTRTAIAELFAPAAEAPAEPTVVPLALAKEPTNPGRIFYDVGSEPITRRLSVSMVEEALAALNAGAQSAPATSPTVASEPTRADAAAASAPEHSTPASAAASAEAASATGT